MKLTHFGHSCVLVECDGSRILIDPGVFSAGFEELSIDAILVTHRHLDHFDDDRIAVLLEKNPEATLWVELSTPLEHPRIDPERVVAVTSGEALRIKETQVRTLGGTHGAIHPDLEVTPNVGFYFPNEQFLHPGDDFIRPDLPVRVLAVPISGLWQAFADVVDYVRAITPAIAVPIHEGLLSDPSVVLHYLDQLKPQVTTLRLWDAPGVGATI